MDRACGSGFVRYERTLPPIALAELVTAVRVGDSQTTKSILEAHQITQLLTETGLAIVNGLGALEQQAQEEAFPFVCRAFGSLLPQSLVESTDSLIREIRYRGRRLGNRAVRYSDSRVGGSYHTDGVPVPAALPDLIALLCVRQATDGGELVFIESQRAVTVASKRMPGLIDVLASLFHFDQRRADDPRATVTRHIIESADRNSSVRLVYLRDYVESGHAIDGIRPLTDLEVQAMDVLDGVLNDEALHIEGRLLPGQIAISDNHRYLHGRHGYVDNPGINSGRLMLRCWIRRSSK